jgi:uncharacterized SAM-binding protein YcdF (DUF218 family)
LETAKIKETRLLSDYRVLSTEYDKVLTRNYLPPMLLFLSKLLQALLFPVGLTILLCLWVIWRSFRNGAVLTGFLALLAASVLYTAANPWVANRLMTGLEQQTQPLQAYPRATAIVLLGGGMIPQGAPRIHPETNAAGDRVMHAARLWRRKCAPRIVVTGGYIKFLTDAREGNAGQYAALLTELFDVPDSALLRVPGSLTTIEDAALTARLFDSTGLKKEILLVTSASHMPRATALFRKRGFSVTEAPTDFNGTARRRFRIFDLLPSAEALDQTSTALREHLGTAVNRILGKV